MLQDRHNQVGTMLWLDGSCTASCDTPLSQEMVDGSFRPVSANGDSPSVRW